MKNSTLYLKKNMFRTSLHVLIGLLVISTTIHARYTLDQFQEAGGSYTLGFNTIDSENYVAVGYAPNLKFKGIDIGLNLNATTPLGDYSTRSESLQLLTFRHIGYTHKDQWGARWGRLKNVTLGYGLLMNQYDSGSGGSSVLSNQKAGFMGFSTMGNSRVDVVYTANNMRAGRVSYRFKPLLIGATVVHDLDGVDETINKKYSIRRPSQMGYSFDVGVPLSKALVVYSEFATLEKSGKEYGRQGKGGSGLSVGAKGRVAILDYVAEFRQFNHEFTPGYFNSSYEATSYNFANDPLNEAIAPSSILINAAAHILEGHIKLGGGIENYNIGVSNTIFSLGWKKIMGTVGAINYTVPIQNDYKILDADILYSIGIIDYALTLKRTYVNADEYVDSYTIGIRYNFS